MFALFSRIGSSADPTFSRFGTPIRTRSSSPTIPATISLAQVYAERKLVRVSELTRDFDNI
ncbi:hypothetical protein A2U01_0038935, partial [Trifolium medium]|nr:hypothetical protein [Trifolium medium]